MQLVHLLRVRVLRFLQALQIANIRLLQEATEVAVVLITVALVLLSQEVRVPILLQEVGVDVVVLIVHHLHTAVVASPVVEAVVEAAAVAVGNVDS